MNPYQVFENGQIWSWSLLQYPPNSLILTENGS